MKFEEKIDIATTYALPKYGGEIKHDHTHYDSEDPMYKYRAEAVLEKIMTVFDPSQWKVRAALQLKKDKEAFKEAAKRFKALKKLPKASAKSKALLNQLAKDAHGNWHALLHQMEVWGDMKNSKGY